jgi:hypothetical protein
LQLNDSTLVFYGDFYCAGVYPLHRDRNTSMSSVVVINTIPANSHAPVYGLSVGAGSLVDPFELIPDLLESDDEILRLSTWG